MEGESGADTDAMADLLAQRQMVLPPVVLTEILSEPRLQRTAIAVLSAIPVLEVLDGYWVRAGELRAKVIAAGYKAKVADVLIAQSCIDHRVRLLTNDRDFRHFLRWGLVLA
jgi:predicted nucleic acid-binding protein